MLDEWDFNEQTIEFFKRACGNTSKIEKITASYAYGKQIKSPKKIYRGISHENDATESNDGASFEGFGLYTTANKKLASSYGSVKDMEQEDIPSKPLCFVNYNMFEIWCDSVMRKGCEFSSKREYNHVLLNEIVNFINENYDGLQIGQGAKAMWVKYPPINELRKGLGMEKTITDETEKKVAQFASEQNTNQSLSGPK